MKARADTAASSMEGLKNFMMEKMTLIRSVTKKVLDYPSDDEGRSFEVVEGKEEFEFEVEVGRFCTGRRKELALVDGRRSQTTRMNQLFSAKCR